MRGLSNKPLYRQRSLLDQIDEELLSKKSNINMATEVKTTAAKTATPLKQVSASEIKALLKEGVTRFEKDDTGKGSIQKKYGLTRYQVIDIFKHPKLKGLKVKHQTITVIDDLPEVEEEAKVDPAPEATISEPEEDLFV